MAEFYGEVSVVARIHFGIEANSKEDAKQKLFNANLPMRLVDDDGNEVCELYDIEWHMVDKVRPGNVQETNLYDFYIEHDG